MTNLFLKPKSVILFFIFTFVLLYVFLGKLAYLAIAFGIALNWSWVITSVYYQKKYHLLKSMNVPLDYRKTKLSMEVIDIIGDCIIERSNKRNKFILGIYNINDNSLLMALKNKQYYSQIDCNANCNDFGLVLVLSENEKREQFIKWLSEKLPCNKHFFHEENKEIIVSINTSLLYKYNSPLIAEILYGYLEINDKITYVKSKYIYR